MLRNAGHANFYKPDEVRAILKESLQIVGEAKVDADLRPVALELVYGSLAQRQVELEQVNASGVLLGKPPMQG